MYSDLSNHHKMITDLFSDQLNAPTRLFEISQDQIQFFHQNGYLPEIKILNDSQIQVLLEQLQKLSDPAGEGHELFYEFHSNESKDPFKVLFHALGAWRIQKGFHDILWSPAFVIPAFQLLGGPVRFWHDQLFCKPAKHGGVVAWHQDYSYWTRTQPMGHLTCWIALDDADENNGCLHYIPKSNHWDLLPITGLAGDMESIRNVLTENQFKEFKPVSVPLKKGYASFHHPLTIHGSFENKSPNPRRAVVLNVFLDGTISTSNEPLLKGVPVITSGSKMEGQFFPLLHDGNRVLS
ncbi:MAG: hypothetical protein RL595_1349 [Planctomycetota bacterium]